MPGDGGSSGCCAGLCCRVEDGVDLRLAGTRAVVVDMVDWVGRVEGGRRALDQCRLVVLMNVRHHIQSHWLQCWQLCDVRRVGRRGRHRGLNVFVKVKSKSRHALDSMKLVAALNFLGLIFA